MRKILTVDGNGCRLAERRAGSQLRGGSSRSTHKGNKLVKKRTHKHWIGQIHRSCMLIAMKNDKINIDRAISIK